MGDDFWKPEYNLGLSEIDKEHRELLGLMSALKSETIKSKPDLLSRVIDTLIEYTKKHFLLEERLMRNVQYPNVESQIKLHRKFIEKVERFKTNFTSSKDNSDHVILQDDIIEFLETWLQNHILTEDRDYVVYMRTHNLAT